MQLVVVRGQRQVNLRCGVIQGVGSFRSAENHLVRQSFTVYFCVYLVGFESNAARTSEVLLDGSHGGRLVLAYNQVTVSGLEFFRRCDFTENLYALVRCGVDEGVGGIHRPARFIIFHSVSFDGGRFGDFHIDGWFFRT